MFAQISKQALRTSQDQDAPTFRGHWLLMQYDVLMSPGDLRACGDTRRWIYSLSIEDQDRFIRAFNEREGKK